MIEKERIFSPDILNTQAYKVAEVDKSILKLDAMEFPIDFPQDLRTKWLELLKDLELNRYPRARNELLENKLRKVFGISSEHGILFGNGSDELIQILVTATRGEQALVMSVYPTFVMYHNSAKFVGSPYLAVALNEDFSLDLETMQELIELRKPNLIFLAQPNNPTGNAFPEADICKIVETANNAIVVIDEAYQAFCHNSMAHLANKYENVLILRTISKVGFAGIRFGYLFGNMDLISEINKVRAPYNSNVITQLTVEFLLDHYDLIKKETSKVCEEREKLFARLKSFVDCKVYPSDANFLVFKVPDSELWFEELKNHGILVKNLNGSCDYLKNCLRLTVGFSSENDKLIEALEAVAKKFK